MSHITSYVGHPLFMYSLHALWKRGALGELAVGFQRHRMPHEAGACLAAPTSLPSPPAAPWWQHFLLQLTLGLYQYVIIMKDLWWSLRPSTLIGGWAAEGKCFPNRPSVNLQMNPLLSLHRTTEDMRWHAEGALNHGASPLASPVAVGSREQKDFHQVLWSLSVPPCLPAVCFLLPITHNSPSINCYT